MFIANSVQDYLFLLERTVALYQLATGILALALIGLLLFHLRRRHA